MIGYLMARAGFPHVAGAIAMMPIGLLLGIWLGPYLQSFLAAWGQFYGDIQYVWWLPDSWFIASIVELSENTARVSYTWLHEVLQVAQDWLTVRDNTAVVLVLAAYVIAECGIFMYLLVNPYRKGRQPFDPR